MSPSLSQLAHASASLALLPPSPLPIARLPALSAVRVCGNSMCPCGSIISSFIDPIYVTGETIRRYALPRVALTLSLHSLRERGRSGRRNRGEQRFKMYHKLAQKSTLKSRGLQLSINHRTRRLSLPLLLPLLLLLAVLWPNHMHNLYVNKYLFCFCGFASV